MITVDSAAEESVCPKEWGEVYELKEPEKWLRFTNASGGRMGHYGAKEATFLTANEKTLMSLGFQVSDVQKPLAAGGLENCGERELGAIRASTGR